MNVILLTSTKSKMLIFRTQSLIVAIPKDLGVLLLVGYYLFI